MNEPDNLAPAPVEETPPETYPPWGYGDLALFILAGFVSLIVAGIAVRGALLALLWSGHGKTLGLLAAQFLGFGLAFAFLAVLLRVKYGQAFWSSLQWVRPRERIGQHLGAGLALAFTIAIAGAALRTPDIDMPIKELLRDRLSIVLVGIAAATIGPVCEELAFRGFLFPLLARTFGAAGGILGCALPFALLHGPQYAWSWRHILLITAAGCAFGWMRHRSGSTAASAVMHAAYNATLFSAYLIQGKDLPTQW